MNNCIKYSSCSCKKKVKEILSPSHMQESDKTAMFCGQRFQRGGFPFPRGHPIGAGSPVGWKNPKKPEVSWHTTFRESLVCYTFGSRGKRKGDAQGRRRDFPLTAERRAWWGGYPLCPPFGQRRLIGANAEIGRRGIQRYINPLQRRSPSYPYPAISRRIRLSAAVSSCSARRFVVMKCSAVSRTECSHPSSKPNR